MEDTSEDFSTFLKWKPKLIETDGKEGCIKNFARFSKVKTIKKYIRWTKKRAGFAKRLDRTKGKLLMKLILEKKYAQFNDENSEAKIYNGTTLSTTKLTLNCAFFEKNAEDVYKNVLDRTGNNKS